MQAGTSPPPLKALRRRAIEFAAAMVAMLAGGLLLSSRVSPGAIAFTRIPCGASDNAIDRVSPTTPLLVAE